MTENPEKPRRPPAQRQIGVSLPDDVRDRLEEEARKASHSIAEEIRRRIERTFEQDLFDRPELQELSAKICLMAVLASMATGKSWHQDPATAYLLKLAIDALMVNRHDAIEIAEIPTTVKFRRDGLVASTDPAVIAVALETLVNFQLKDAEGNLDRRGLQAALSAAQRERGTKS
jgi:hypothetical protein